MKDVFKNGSATLRLSRTTICFCGALIFVLLSSVLHANPSPQVTPKRDRYQAELARLESMISVPLNQWRYHVANFPHPEDPFADDSSWSSVTFGGNAASARAPADELGWYRAWIEIPSLGRGKDVGGARIHLILHSSTLARVFFNSTMVGQGSERLLLPILITEHAVPGEKILVAVTTNRLTGARLSIDYPGQADPYLLRREIMSAEALMAGFSERAAERQQQLDAAIHAIDFAALDHRYDRAE